MGLEITRSFLALRGRLTLDPQLTKLDTSVRARSNSDEAPTSVIHAPPGFKNFVSRCSFHSVR